MPEWVGIRPPSLHVKSCSVLITYAHWYRHWPVTVSISDCAQTALKCWGYNLFYYIFYANGRWQVDIGPVTDRRKPADTETQNIDRT